MAGVAFGAAYGWISLQAHIKQWKRYADELESENAYLAEQLELETRIYNRLKTDLTNKFSRHETDFSQPETQADQQGRLLVAEGIETALAARALFQLPAVAALSANGMRRFEIPANVQEIYIAADNDHSRTGFHAAHDLAVRAIKQGVIAHIWQPEIAGMDALDEYNRRQSFNQSQI